MRRIAALVLAAGALAWGAIAHTRDDDVPVDPTAPGAQRAVAEALTVVPGRVVEIARDSDNGKWEVIVAHDGGEYEIELAPGTFELLRLDYD
jgi:Peptidase propeptide and YPEB domain